MATQTADSSHRDDAMTAGGPGADSQAPPSFGASNSGTGNGAGDTSEQSASDSEKAPAQGAPTTAADSSQPANAQPTSTNDGRDTASTSDNGPAHASGNSDGSANSGSGDASASAANSGGSASAADGSAGAGNGGSAGSGDGGSSPTAENSDGSGGTASGDHSALHLAGTGALLQPIFDAANGVASDVTGSSGLLHGLVDVADTVGVGAIGAVPSADGHSNLITDLVNFPGDIIGGTLNAGLSHIGTDLSDTANAATGMVGDVLGGNTGGLLSGAASGASGLLHPATDLIGSAGNDLQTAPLASLDGGGLLTGSVGNPGASSSGDAIQVDTSLVGNSPNSLLTVNGGNNAGDGGVAGAGIGDLNGSSSGHLVDLAAGPHGDHDSSVGVLTAQPNGGQAATVSAVDVGPGGPQLANAGLLTDPGALNITSLNGAGTDSLAGGLLGGDTASEATAGAVQPTPVGTNLGEIHDIASVPVTGDHGILDVNQTHII